MKPIHIAAAALFAAMAFASCGKDSYLKYDVSAASLRFDYKAEGNDSTVFSFRFHPGEETGSVEIPVSVIGLDSEHEREIPVEVVAEGTTAEDTRDYTIERSVVEAGSFNGSVRITLRKTPELDSGNKTLEIRLGQNGSFGKAPVNRDRYRIVISNDLIDPEGWIFGDYSVVKHEFVILHTGVANNYWTVWDTSEQIYWKSVLIRALYEYNREHPGFPLADENGKIIDF